jgi:hypothetical protein
VHYCDDGDFEGKKAAERYGFAFEGTSLKNSLIEMPDGSLVSQSTCAFAMLNSDWNAGGARNHLFKKVYGVKAFKNDADARKQEIEQDEWVRISERLDAKAEEGKKKK